MKRVQTFGTVATLCTVLVHTALAADMGAPPHVASQAPSAFDWTGMYLGGRPRGGLSTINYAGPIHIDSSEYPYRAWHWLWRNWTCQQPQFQFVPWGRTNWRDVSGWKTGCRRRCRLVLYLPQGQRIDIVFGKYRNTPHSSGGRLQCFHKLDSYGDRNDRAREGPLAPLSKRWCRFGEKQRCNVAEHALSHFDCSHHHCRNELQHVDRLDRGSWHKVGVS